MSTFDFFHTELHVHFTRNELSTILLALIDSSRIAHSQGYEFTAREIDELYEKVQRFAKLYDSSAVL